MNCRCQKSQNEVLATHKSTQKLIEQRKKYGCIVLFFSKTDIGLNNISITFLILIRHKNTLVVENNKSGSLNTLNRDVYSDDINNTVNTQTEHYM